MNQRVLLSASASVMCMASLPPTAFAQAAEAPDSRPEIFGDIVVTAQKRAQSSSDVGMSINALGGEALLQNGVGSPADLSKLVPGLTYTQTPYATPVYTIRGIGFYESSLAASPAVSVYIDEVGLPFPAMTSGAVLDLERVEVLKGPQGTLFGQNSTGGAINFVAAKPTDVLHYGTHASYARFGAVNAGGFVSGPLTSTLKARLAVESEQGGAWQRSFTRTEKLGDRNFLNGRLLLDWLPTNSLRVAINVSAWRDRSETQAAQLIRQIPRNPAQQKPVAIASPLTNTRSETADWTPGLDYRSRDRFYHLSGRIDYDVSDSVTLTAISSYQRYKVNSPHDNDGSAARIIAVRTVGKVSAAAQEVRLSGTTTSLRWIIGGNYERDSSDDTQLLNLPDSSAASLFGIALSDSRAFSTNRIANYAAFANFEYDVSPELTLHAGLRYTDVRRRFSGCTADSGDGKLAAAFTLLQGVLKRDPVTGQLVRPVVTVAPGGCYTLDANLDPGLVTDRLNENNVSWRVGADYDLGANALLYANVSRGYKSGSFATLGATNASQYRPVTQESVTAYELGLKTPLFGRVLQFNASGFYYDYRNKQLRSKVPDLLFRLLDALVNVPKSRVVGGEIQLVGEPMRGLTIDASATYLDTKIQRHAGINAFEFQQSFAGSPFPYTPEVQLSARADYSWAVSGSIDAFIGANVVHNSRTNSQFYTAATISPLYGSIRLFEIRDFTTLDLRAGIEAAEGRWRLTAFGRNITNQYYWNSSAQVSDVAVRYAARPLTYGFSVEFRY